MQIHPFAFINAHLTRLADRGQNNRRGLVNTNDRVHIFRIGITDQAIGVIYRGDFFSRARDGKPAIGVLRRHFGKGLHQFTQLLHMGRHITAEMVAQCVFKNRIIIDRIIKHMTPLNRRAAVFFNTDFLARAINIFVPTGALAVVNPLPQRRHNGAKPLAADQHGRADSTIGNALSQFVNHHLRRIAAGRRNQRLRRFNIQMARHA